MMMVVYEPIKTFGEDAIVEIQSSCNSTIIQQQGQEQEGSSTSKQQQHRLVSLDVFRGLTVLLMIFVEYAGGVLPAINHSPWNSSTLADYVMPFFLFIAGVALALAYKRLPCRLDATMKAVLRALQLFGLGLFLQGGYFHGVNNLTYGVDIEQIRVMGILQRIAIAYLLAAACEIWLKRKDDVSSILSLLKKYRYQWVVTLTLIAVYLTFLYGLYVADWEYQIPAVSSSSSPKKLSVKCGVQGDTSPACNAVGMVDRKVFGIQHLYRRPSYARTQQCSINSPESGPLPFDAPSWCQAPFDPEGLLSSMMAAVTCLIGLHYGHIILHYKDHRERIVHWAVPSSCLVVLGLALDLFGMRINKPLYTLSYTCVTTGSAGLVFAAIYYMVDFCEHRRPTLAFEWIGRRSLLIFSIVACNGLPVVIQGFFWRQPENNILKLIGVGS